MPIIGLASRDFLGVWAFTIRTCGVFCGHNIDAGGQKSFSQRVCGLNLDSWWELIFKGIRVQWPFDALGGSMLVFKF